MANTFNAITTGTGGISTTGDTSGTFAFTKDGGAAVVTISGTGAMTLGAALPVASGGTGAATLTANNVLLGNGTSAVTGVAPSTSGNLLTSNGTTWTSAAAPSSTPTTAQVGTASAGFAAGDLGSYAFLLYATANTNITFGTNYAGSSLRTAGVIQYSLTVGATMATAGSGSAVSGTWKSMGGGVAVGSGGGYLTSLFLRVA